MLDRRLAAEGHYPPISILNSISRIMPSVISPAHMAKAGEIRRLLALYRANEELIRIGAYLKNSDVDLEKAIALTGPLRAFLVQGSQEKAAFQDSLDQLMRLPT
jgi:flagellum-specific ATP synthase